jgi:RNA polymerase sigma-70 factor (ECF subfamily)
VCYDGQPSLAALFAIISNEISFKSSRSRTNLENGRREHMANMATIRQETASVNVDCTSDTQLSDEALLAAYRQTGDRQLFSQLVQRYEKELFNYLRRYLGDAELAEDVFQMAFLMVHMKCDQFEPGRRFRPWLYAIATNAGIDAQRREKRHKATSLDNYRAPGSDEPRLSNLLTSNDPDPFAEASRMESGEWVQQAMDGLTDQMRDVVNLVYFQGLKYREAAETLNIPVGTIKSRLHAAVQKLYDYWQTTHTP